MPLRVITEAVVEVVLVSGIVVRLPLSKVPEAVTRLVLLEAEVPPTVELPTLEAALVTKRKGHGRRSKAVLLGRRDCSRLWKPPSGFV